MSTDAKTVRQIALEYLMDSKLMQVATFGETDPGFAHVWFAPNPDLDLFFASNTSRRHSGQIRDHELVAFGVVGIPLEGLGQKVRGVTGYGVAAELYDDAAAAGFDVYASRWPKAHEAFPLSQIESGASPMRIYRIRPTSLVLWDEVNFPDSPKQQVI